MTKDPAFPLQCPVCRDNLQPDAHGLACAAGHRFDAAREGYVNVLLSHHRKSNQAGDSPEMIASRQAFLDGGHYDPLVHALCAATKPLDPKVVLDAGCGTGHFLAALAAQHPDARCCGIDISKPGIKAAAKAFPGHHWIIANFMRELPVKSDTVDVLLNLMSPRKVEEFARVLKKDGRMIMLVPGAEHLEELRAILMENPADDIDKAARAEAACAAHFMLLDRQVVAFDLDLDGPQMRQLIGMTPLTWKASRSGMAAAEERENLQVKARFELLVFKRT
ncbi:MAG: 23S rRNA (guanine745-N1)-methyltransferase [Kiritimatiellia bacterium]|jgi:23S rRNA (guanine745-N1)-methyltransferase